MDTLMNFVSAIFRTALKLVLIAAAAVFALSLIVVALLSVVWVLLKALLTGRKPAFVTTFQRFNQARQQFKRGGFGAAGTSLFSSASIGFASAVAALAALNFGRNPAGFVAAVSDLLAVSLDAGAAFAAEGVGIASSARR